MENEILQIEKILEHTVNKNGNTTHLPPVCLKEIVSEIFSIGPFYYYLLNYFDSSISYLSNGFQEAHGVEPNQIQTASDILKFIHPDDLPAVVNTEEMAYTFLKETVGIEKIKEYKLSYNVRLKTSSGKYQLYNHQALVLSTDEKGNYDTILNICTNINHITNINNKKLSLISLTGHPSYLNMDVLGFMNGQHRKVEPLKIFSTRELQIINMIADGMDSKEIAKKLFISVLTVKTHRKNIISKSGCSNAAELVARGKGEGWI